MPSSATPDLPTWIACPRRSCYIAGRHWSLDAAEEQLAAADLDALDAYYISIVTEQKVHTFT